MIKNIFDVTIYSWIASESKRNNLRFTAKLKLKIWRNSDFLAWKIYHQSINIYLKDNLFLNIIYKNWKIVARRRFKVLLRKSIHFCGCAGVRGDSKAKRKRRRWRNNIAEKNIEKSVFSGVKELHPSAIFH